MKLKITFIATILSLIGYSQCKSGDCENGTGLYQYEGGDYFKGLFKNGEMFQGKYHFKTSGHIYEGTFINQKLNGPNCSITTSNQIMTGLFKSGKLIDGKITRNSELGTDEFIGKFNDNMLLEGKGEFKRVNEDGEYISKGQFINGKLNDKNGYIHFTDKRYYEGEVKENLPNGEGKMTFPNENFQEGIFLDGIFQRGLDLQKRLDNHTKVIPLMFNKEHGVYYIDINVSGTNFETIFDTGAAFLVLDKGYIYNALKKGEILKDGTVTTSDANNNVVEKDKYVLKSVKIGDIELKNVEAVGNDIGGPSLFGVGLLKLIGSKFILDFQNSQVNIME